MNRNEPWCISYILASILRYFFVDLILIDRRVSIEIWTKARHSSKPLISRWCIVLMSNARVFVSDGLTLLLFVHNMPWQQLLDVNKSANFKRIYNLWWFYLFGVYGNFWDRFMGINNWIAIYLLLYYLWIYGMTNWRILLHCQT